MSENERDRALEYLLDRRSGRVADHGRPSLNEEDRAEVESLVEVADLLWEVGHGAPPLEQDPVAAMLGLIPDAGYQLDPRALTRARKNVKFKPSELAERLVARGWEVQTKDIFRWESQNAAEVSPALVRAIAEELGVDADQITASEQRTSQNAAVAEATDTSRFQALAQRWARATGQTLAMAASTLQSRMLTTVHRGDHPDADQMLQSLESLVAAVEQGHRR
ncbi:hypothetical protein [Nocardia gipuzkoensis]